MILRYPAALFLMIYGFSKINGVQFAVLDSELDKPMGMVSGFWLTWYYFGYSPVFKVFLGLVEIGGGLLLTFRRTMVLGAAMLIPLLANVVLIDFIYGVEPGAAIVALLLLALMCSILATRWAELRALLWTPAAPDPRLRSAAKWAIRAVSLAAAFGINYWSANVNTRVPTPIDGAWDVVSPPPEIPASIFFERNRAFMVVFKSQDGAYTTHHFELAPNGGIEISDRWLAKGDTILKGAYRLANEDLTISGDWRGAGLTELHLRPRRLH